MNIDSEIIIHVAGNEFHEIRILEMKELVVNDLKDIEYQLKYLRYLSDKYHVDPWKDGIIINGKLYMLPDRWDTNE
jgi:hypothetical protein